MPPALPSSEANSRQQHVNIVSANCRSTTRVHHVSPWYHQYFFRDHICCLVGSKVLSNSWASTNLLLREEQHQNVERQITVHIRIMHKLRSSDRSCLVLEKKGIATGLGWTQLKLQ